MATRNSFEGKLIRGRGSRVSSSQIKNMFKIAAFKVSGDDGWQILGNLIKERTKVFGATEKAIFDANFQLATLIRENIKKRVASGTFYRRLSPLTKAIEENRTKFGSSVARTARSGKVIRSNPLLELGKFSRQRRKPLFRTGALMKSLTLARSGEDGKGTIAVGFPNTRRPNSDKTNADIARIVESGFQVRIPPSAKGLGALGFPAGIANQRQGIRGFMSILAMVGDFAQPFPPAGGVTYRVPPRPIRLPVVQSMTALSSKDSSLASDVYILAFLESVLSRTFGPGKQSAKTRQALAALARGNADVLRRRRAKL